MTQKSLTIAIVTALCGAPIFALAQPGGGPGRWGKPSFEELDANQDGKVTAAELQAQMSSHFARFDADKNGKVTKQEAEAFFASKRAEHEKMRGEHGKMRAEHAQAFFDAQDANKDGKLSKQELSRLPGDWFERLDLNGDELVTQDEMKEAHQMMKDDVGKRMHGRGARMFERLDGNKDGVVDQREIAAQAKERFERLDADKNGALSKEELSARGCGFHHGRGRGHGEHGGKHSHGVQS